VNSWTPVPPSGTTPITRPDVGYGRPPTEHQFRPGESGNRRGRPKGSKNEATLINEILNRKIEVVERGKPRRISLLEGILLKFAEDALRGNPKAATFLLNRKLLAESSEPSVSVALDKDDRKILASYTQQLHEQFKKQEAEK
jgi:hypothetical protein